jgi:RimJ/RimL family protein N-acetyltransferase
VSQPGPTDGGPARTVVITSRRLRLRPWRIDDTDSALRIFGSDRIAPWLAPAMARVGSAEEMATILARWIDEDLAPGRPVGRWVVEHRETGEVVGAASVQPLPPGDEDLAITWQVAPEAWGHGYGAEAGHALAHHAFQHGEEELFVVMRPRNDHAVETARRMNMDWVGETEKYYDLRLHVYRMRKAELDRYTLAPDHVETRARTGHEDVGR